MYQLSKQIAIHHVGGRAGSSAIPANSYFKDDMSWTFYEADDTCIEQIQENIRSLGQVTVLPYCLGKTEGTATLHINKDPYTSSLLAFNENYARYYYFTVDPEVGPIDYVYGETVACMEQRTVNVLPLKSVVDRGEAKPPDFLSMDTQGSEYEILLGCGNLLESQVLAIQTEIEFQPVYKDQKLCGHMMELLSQHGFIFARFTELHEMAPNRGVIGARADGFQVFGEGLFLKSPDQILASHDPSTQYTKLMKLAYIAITYHLLEFAGTCLKAAAELKGADEAVKLLEKTSFARFLQGLVQKMEDGVRPSTFNDHYDYSRNKTCVSKNEDSHTFFPRFINNLRREVKRRGGKRLCLTPFGKIGREYWASNPVETPELASVVFCDNHPKQEPGGPEVLHSESIEAQDFVLVTSYAYGAAIRNQFIQEQGLSQQKVLSIHDLKSGEQDIPVDRTSFSAMEQYLDDWGFTELAAKVYRKRVLQSLFL